jgi:hypothetical protein
MARAKGASQDAHSKRQAVDGLPPRGEPGRQRPVLFERLEEGYERFRRDGSRLGWHRKWANYQTRSRRDQAKADHLRVGGDIGDLVPVDRERFGKRRHQRNVPDWAADIEDAATWPSATMPR